MILTATLFDIKAIYAKCNEEARVEMRKIFGHGHFNEYPKIKTLTAGSGIGMSKLHPHFHITSVDTGNNIVFIGDKAEWSDDGGVVQRFRDDDKGHIYLELVGRSHIQFDIMMLERKGLTIK